MDKEYAESRLRIVRKKKEECKSQINENLNNIKTLKNRIEVYNTEEEMLLKELKIRENA